MIRQLIFLFMMLASPQWIAHRGVHLECTVAGENSLEAVELAARAGFEYIETDCRWTSDKVMVIMHDATLNRTCTFRDGTGLGQEPVNVSDLSFERLRSDYRLKADSPERRSIIPTLEEYLIKCREQGLMVMIEPKVNDETGAFYEDIVRIADKVLGRKGYLIVSNNFANSVIRRNRSFDSVGLMGILYQTDWKTMAGLGNTIFAISSTRYTADQFRQNYERAVSEGRTVESSTGLGHISPQTNFETYQMLQPYGGGISLISTDQCTPYWHGQGKLVTDFSAKSPRIIEKRLSRIPVAELYGIYLDIEFEGKAEFCVGPDRFNVDSSKGGRARYSRTVYNCAPSVSITPEEGFKIVSCHIKVIEI